MGFQRTPEQMSKEIDVLQRDVFHAKVHFDIFKGLIEAWPEYNQEIQNSPCFWDFTRQAHIDAAVQRLCRIYDKDNSALQLARFLEESIKKNPNLFSEAAFKACLLHEPHRDVGRGRFLQFGNHGQANDQFLVELGHCPPLTSPIAARLKIALWADFVVDR